MLQHALAGKYRESFLIFASGAFGQGTVIAFSLYLRRLDKAESEKNLNSLQTPRGMQPTTITPTK